MRAPCNLSGRWWTCRWTIVTCWCGRAYWSLTRPPTTRWGCTPCHLLSVLLGSLPDRPGVSSGVPLQASQGQLQDQDLPSKHWREGPGIIPLIDVCPYSANSTIFKQLFVEYYPTTHTFSRSGKSQNLVRIYPQNIQALKGSTRRIKRCNFSSLYHLPLYWLT